jgi:hypothetical protein
MKNTGYTHFADALVFVHGPKALTEATRHAELALRTGDQEMAAHWLATIEQIKAAKALQLARAA